MKKNNYHNNILKNAQISSYNNLNILNNIIIIYLFSLSELLPKKINKNMYRKYMKYNYIIRFIESIILIIAL